MSYEDIVMSYKDIKHRFTNHPPEDDTVALSLDGLTQMFIETAYTLDLHLPDSREKSLALTKLEECSMWSKAAIARHQPSTRGVPDVQP